MMISHERDKISMGEALLALTSSSLLRMLWLGLIVIVPDTTSGAFFFYLVLGCVGVVLLHWSLSRLGWQVSLGGAITIRVFPWLVAGTAASLLHVNASMLAVAAVAGIEILIGLWVLRTAATPEWRHESAAECGLESMFLPAELGDIGRYEESAASLVRQARLAIRS